MPVVTVMNRIFFCVLTICVFVNTGFTESLKRAVSPAVTYTDKIPATVNSSCIIMKLKEGTESVPVKNNRLQSSSPEISNLNKRLEIISHDKAENIQPHFSKENFPLDEWRQKAKQMSNVELADLTLYYKLRVNKLTETEKIALINDLNKMAIVEVAYFPHHLKPLYEPLSDYQATNIETITPNWEEYEDHLKPAPLGLDSYYLWKYKYGKGDNVKVVDVEFGWHVTHEDLRGGTENFVIGINSDMYRYHGTAIMGTIAADSNYFGMTGMAFNADLAGISVDDGVNDNFIADEILNAIVNSDTGDVILIEVSISSPFYVFGRVAYVPVEYEQENFDAVQYATALRRVVVEPVGNSIQDLDDPKYEDLFNVRVRNSGAIYVGASDWGHLPMEYMTNYGSRVDVHSYGRDVYSLCCGDLYGTNPDNYYTAQGAGTSAAGALIAGACLQLQSLYKSMYNKILTADQMRGLFFQYNTPQIPHFMHIGGMPDIAACAYSFTKFDFSADTLKGQVPFDVSFTANHSITANNWLWDFGDGTIDTVQNPTHTFTQPGIYDISATMVSDSVSRKLVAESYILVTADSLFGDSMSGFPGQSLQLTLSAKNMLPLRKFIVPISFDGPLNLTYDSCNTEGCLDTAFSQFTMLNYDGFNNRMTLAVSTGSDNPLYDLPPGEGPVLNLYFTSGIDNPTGTEHIITVTGYNSYRPEFQSPQFAYTYPVSDASFTMTLENCCQGIRGNINYDPEDQIDISDLLYLVDYMFAVPAGPSPVCMPEADINNSSSVDLSDLLYLVDYFFLIPSGPAPLPCE